MSCNFGLYFGNCVQMLRLQNLLFYLKTRSISLAGSERQTLSRASVQFMKFSLGWATQGVLRTWVFQGPSETGVDGGWLPLHSALQQSPVPCSLWFLSLTLAPAGREMAGSSTRCCPEPTSAALSTGWAAEMAMSKGASPCLLLRQALPQSLRTSAHFSAQSRWSFWYHVDYSCFLKADAIIPRSQSPPSLWKDVFTGHQTFSWGFLPFSFKESLRFLLANVISDVECVILSFVGLMWLCNMYLCFSYISCS